MNITRKDSPTLKGNVQISSKVANLQQAAGDYIVFIGNVQYVMLNTLILRLPNIDVSDDINLTSISIQTDDVTPYVLISSTDGAKANLTAEKQLIWTGKVLISPTTSITLTINGGAADESTVCDIITEYKATDNGGKLL